MLHFRTSTNQEVDIVPEMPNGEVVGIEIKSGANVGRDAFKGLRMLENDLGRKFKCGIVIYTGETATAFDKNMFAVPIQRIWEKDLKTEKLNLTNGDLNRCNLFENFDTCNWQSWKGKI